jgi:hypothetical protein
MENVRISPGRQAGTSFLRRFGCPLCRLAKQDEHVCSDHGVVVDVTVLGAMLDRFVSDSAEPFEQSQFAVTCPQSRGDRVASGTLKWIGRRWLITTLYDDSSQTNY